MARSRISSKLSPIEDSDVALRMGDGREPLGLSARVAQDPQTALAVGHVDQSISNDGIAERLYRVGSQQALECNIACIGYELPDTFGSMRIAKVKGL